MIRTIFPYVCLGLAVLMSSGHLRKALDTGLNDEGFDLRSYGRVPVQADGRVKPMDTVARNSLYLLYGKESLKQEDGSRMPAIRWFADLQMRPQIADDYRVFRIDNDQILSLFGMQQADRKYFSYNEIKPFEQQVFRLTEQAQAKDRSQRDLFEQQLLKLGSGLMRYRAISSYALPAVIAPAGDEDPDHWHTLIEIIQNEGLQTSGRRAPVLFYRKLIESYHSGDSAPFNATVAGLIELLKPRHDTGKTDFEYFFQTFNPFLQSEIFYVFAFILACVSWANWQKPLRNAAALLIVFSFIIHTFGLLARMYIQGRPPVTNLYSSAIFVGWAAVLLAILLEIYQKNGIGAAVAAMCGFSTLLIAPALSGSTDSLEMMQAVLDSNFWLATHVVVISLGYSAMYVAGFLAIIFILRGVLTRSLDSSTAQALARATYATICFAMLFSFVGTMLGGIWADQSWGRFWGWDPKENGALLIVLWCALVLHARWARLCQARGLMLMAVFGNVITAWSWFGTNMLGVGLHSYGFSDNKFMALALFVASQLFIIGLGLFPKQQWRSHFSARA